MNKSGAKVNNGHERSVTEGTSSDIDLMETPRATEVPAEAGRHVTMYKVYKRRFFGLAQLVLLNIIVSWDVSAPERKARSLVKWPAHPDI